MFYLDKMEYVGGKESGKKSGKKSGKESGKKGA
jgi:hypothetical protein